MINGKNFVKMYTCILLINYFPFYCLTLSLPESSDKDFCDKKSYITTTRKLYTIYGADDPSIRDEPSLGESFRERTGHPQRRRQL